MALATIYTRAQLGIDAPLVSVEVHISNGLPGFTMVGLPETAVKESKDRVRSALINSHFEFPQKRITVNLAPADLPKEGGRYDLAIAIGILAASEQLPAKTLNGYEFLGELALSGDIRPVTGCIPAALNCGKAGRSLITSIPNGHETALCSGTTSYIASNLLSVCAHLHQRDTLLPAERSPEIVRRQREEKDLRDIKGQLQARRALEIAAAGGHNLLFFGPPGTGKSMLASRLSSILPPLAKHEALEVASIRSVTNNGNINDLFSRPYRSPHHTSSAAAMVGGGSHPKPGEISLAHHGILFLDELPEFPRNVLEVLREPLESGHICLSRARTQIQYPAKVQLIAAMNPCPCGFYSDKKNRCQCTPQQIARYRSKISGPLLDRIDLHVPVNTMPVDELHTKPNGESSDIVRERVIASRQRQLLRQKTANAHLQGQTLHNVCELGDEQKRLLGSAMERLNLSARAYDKILRVARTIADMSDSATISIQHLTEALGYRALDRQLV